jgi:hypothetical protein
MKKFIAIHQAKKIQKNKMTGVSRLSRYADTLYTSLSTGDVDKTPNLSKNKGFAAYETKPRAFSGALRTTSVNWRETHSAIFPLG